jgi:hypothetical protein
VSCVAARETLLQQQARSSKMAMMDDHTPWCVTAAGSVSVVVINASHIHKLRQSLCCSNTPC